VTSGFRISSGADLDSVFTMYSSGSKPVLTGFRTSAGQDARDRYQPYTSGQKASNTGFRNAAGTDLRDLFQYVNSGSSTLPINGNSYERNKGRGTATLSFNMNSAGTYSITDDLGNTFDSGTWLPAGDSASSYSCTFTNTGANEADPEGGSDFTATNCSATAPGSALTANLYSSINAGATTVGTNASNSGTVTMKLYKSGALVSTTFVNFSVSAAG
jgi:hypothetical protein